MSAAEKLKALDGAMTSGEWATYDAHENEIPCSHWAYYLDQPDEVGVAALRNALPQIVAVVEAATIIANWPPERGRSPWEDLDCALAALDEALP